jgi:hypothetical protein
VEAEPKDYVFWFFGGFPINSRNEYLCFFPVYQCKIAALMATVFNFYTEKFRASYLLNGPARPVALGRHGCRLVPFPGSFCEAKNRKVKNGKEAAALGRQ